MTSKYLLAAVVVLVADLGSRAWAQPAGANVTASGGSYGAVPKVTGKPSFSAPGFRLGNAALHPGLDTSIGYDSNVFYEDSSEHPAGSVELVLKPYVSLEKVPPTKGKSRVDYSLNLGFQYKRYFQEIGYKAQRNFFGANVAGLLKVFPEGTFGFDLHETFLRTSEPRYVVSPNNFDRDYNMAGLGVSFRPGGGLLQFRLGYRLAVDYYEASDLAGANYYFHQAEFYAKWKFFPQTSWWLGATWQFIDYWDNFDTGYKNPGSKPIRVMMGVSGRFLPRLVLTGGIGYGYSWYDRGPDYNLPLGMVDVTIEIGPFAKVSLGYQHDFRDVMVGNYYSVDTAYLTYYHILLNKIRLSATFRWLMAGFQGFQLPAGSQTSDGKTCDLGSNRYCDRTDNAILLGLSAGYIVTDWFSASLSYRLMANFSNLKASDANGNPYSYDYLKHIALVTATFSY